MLRSLIAEASSGERRLSIHVEANNPARRLYWRLGFRQAGEHGVYCCWSRHGRDDFLYELKGARGPL